MVNTRHWVSRTTRSVVLPRNASKNPLCPCVAIAIRSADRFFALPRIRSTMSPGWTDSVQLHPLSRGKDGVGIPSRVPTCSTTHDTSEALTSCESPQTAWTTDCG